MNRNEIETLLGKALAAGGGLDFDEFDITYTQAIKSGQLDDAVIASFLFFLKEKLNEGGEIREALELLKTATEMRMSKAWGKENSYSTETRVTEDLKYCTFCGKSEKEVTKLISGPGNVFICNECVGICKKLIDASPIPSG